MENKTFWQIHEEYQKLYQYIEDNDGELTPDLEEAFNELELSLEEKCRSIKGLINKNNSKIAHINSEIERLEGTKERITKELESITKLANTILEHHGADKKNGTKVIDFGDFEFAQRKSSSVIYDEDNIHDLVENLQKDVFDDTELRFLNRICEPKVSVLVPVDKVVELKESLEQLEIDSSMDIKVKLSKKELKEIINNGEEIPNYIKDTFNPQIFNHKKFVLK